MLSDSGYTRESDGLKSLESPTVAAIVQDLKHCLSGTRLDLEDAGENLFSYGPSVAQCSVANVFDSDIWQVFGM